MSADRNVPPPALPPREMTSLLARALVLALGGTPIEAELVMKRLVGLQIAPEPRAVVDTFRRHLDAIRS